MKKYENGIYRVREKHGVNEEYIGMKLGIAWRLIRFDASLSCYDSDKYIQRHYTIGEKIEPENKKSGNSV